MARFSLGPAGGDPDGTWKWSRRNAVSRKGAGGTLASCPIASPLQGDPVIHLATRGRGPWLQGPPGMRQTHPFPAFLQAPAVTMSIPLPLVRLLHDAAITTRRTPWPDTCS